jgi:hypothetical protein
MVALSGWSKLRRAILSGIKMANILTRILSSRSEQHERFNKLKARVQQQMVDLFTLKRSMERQTRAWPAQLELFSDATQSLLQQIRILTQLKAVCMCVYVCVYMCAWRG